MEDNIKEWTVLSISKSLRVSRYHKIWREITGRSVMAPIRPPEVVA